MGGHAKTQTAEYRRADPKAKRAGQYGTGSDEGARELWSW